MTCANQISHTLAFDSAISARKTDDNGFLHVATSHITKATVNPYYGREIPGWKAVGLNPNSVYYGLRDAEELRKSVPTWEGLPLHIEHHIDSADAPEKLTRVGAVGTAVWNAPYIDAQLTVWDGAAIEAIEDGAFRELSCAYRYDADFTPGTYEGIEYDFIMRNIRGNHVALVEEGRAGPDVVVADAAFEEDKRQRDDSGKFTNGGCGKSGKADAKQRDWDSESEQEVRFERVGNAMQEIANGKSEATIPNLRNDLKPAQGGTMSKIKNWFRGAKDADPGIEQQEVDLAQAIIDLHKVNPETGKIMDVTEDEDKAAEIRKLVGEFAGKLEPEELKKLTDALSGLAYSKATGDAEPDAAKSQDEDAVAAGNEQAKDEEAMDEEAMDEEVKKAMDSCGLDAEDPATTRAFAEGVKYGERKEKEEPKKLDSEHESEGEKKALGEDEDKNAEIDKILASVPDLSEEQAKKLRDALQGLAYSPATGDEDTVAAQDAALRRSRKFFGAMDEARIKSAATVQAKEHFRDLNMAARDVRLLVGEVDPLAFDSAADIYGYALKQNGMIPKKYPRSAWRGMVDILRRNKDADSKAILARDSAPSRMDGVFAGLKNISLGD